MTKSKENEEGNRKEPLASDDEDSSRRGILKRIGLTAAALAAAGLTSSKSFAQGRTAKVPSEEEILADLKKRGITNLEQLAHAAASGGPAMSWCFIIRGKLIYKDDR